jgi:hypothetical protein
MSTSSAISLLLLTLNLVDWLPILLDVVSYLEHLFWILGGHFCSLVDWHIAQTFEGHESYYESHSV